MATPARRRVRRPYGNNDPIERSPSDRGSLELYCASSVSARSRRAWHWTRIALLTLLGSSSSSCHLHNFHTVDDGRLYRSAQLEGSELREYIRNYGIQTVINLRGFSPDKSWYLDEVAVCDDLGVSHFDISMSARRIPHPEEILDLLELFRNAPRPILVHCHGGSDRSGLASALWKIEQQGRTKERAKKMLRVRFLHFEAFTPSSLYFLEIYEGEDWVRDQYDPCSGEYSYYDTDKYCP